MRRNLLCLLAICLAVFSTLFCRHFLIKAEPITLTITVAESPYIEDFSVNHYKIWLEEQTGYHLNFNVIPAIYSDQAVANSILEGTLQTDILFSFDTLETDFFIPQTVNALGMQGLLCPIDKLLSEHSSLRTVAADVTAYDLVTYLAAEDGHLYYAPQLDTSKLATADETLWLNIDWLDTLGLPIPKTTADLATTLIAFAIDDPNNNGLQDEVPFASSGNTSYPCSDYLINAFVYNDTKHYRFFADDAGVQFAPTQSGWREAMIYLSSLYQTNAFSKFTAPLTHHQLSELASSDQDLLGAFTTDDIGQVLWNNHADILMRYIPIPPIRTPEGISHATVSTPLPTVGAIIPTNCTHLEEALILLNVMLSQEASYIAQYGEEGVDWEYATTIDLDSQGEKASLLIHSNLKRLSQNKHFANIGPYCVYPEIADHVFYTNFDTAYLNSRGLLAQEAAQPTQVLSPIVLTGTFYDRAIAIEAYTHQWITNFCSGTYDPTNNTVWSHYLAGYESLGLSALQDYIALNTTITST